MKLIAMEIGRYEGIRFIKSPPLPPKPSVKVKPTPHWVALKAKASKKLRNGKVR